jgi:serine/threonine-protein kinase
MPSRVAALMLAVAVLTPIVAIAAALPHFTQPNAVWNLDVSNAPSRSNSAAMMTHLEDLATTIRGSDCFAPGSGSGCWGDTRIFDFQLDISFYVLHAGQSTTTRAIVENSGYYLPDCEAGGFQVPGPVGGGIEGTGPPPAYTCKASSNDCHLLVVNDDTHVLFEAYNVSKADATGVHALCGLSWDLTRVYPRYGRGEHCTSADAAGFPMAPLMLNADEVWAAAQSNGDIGHAIRFILGNNRMAASLYVHPASHGTTATTDADPNAVPYGSRLRLKTTFDVDAFSSNPAVRAMLRSLQKYGMFLSDGGGVPLSAESDYFTTHKWDDADMNIDSHSLFGIRPTDFEVIEAGDPMTVTYDCVRTPDDFIFIDDFQY